MKKCAKISIKTLEEMAIEREIEEQKRLAERSIYPSGYKYRGLSIFIDEKGMYNLKSEIMVQEQLNRIIMEASVLEYMKQNNLVEFVN